MFVVWKNFEDLILVSMFSINYKIRKIQRTFFRTYSIKNTCKELAVCSLESKIIQINSSKSCDLQNMFWANIRVFSKMFLPSHTILRNLFELVLISGYNQQVLYICTSIFDDIRSGKCSFYFPNFVMLKTSIPEIKSSKLQAFWMFNAPVSVP